MPHRTIERIIGCVLTRQAGSAKKFRFQPQGKQRLEELAARFGVLLDYVAIEQKWEEFVANVSELAIDLSNKIFVNHELDSASDVATCLLDDAGFKLRSGVDPEHANAQTYSAINNGEKDELARVLRDCYAFPLRSEEELWSPGVWQSKRAGQGGIIHN